MRYAVYNSRIHPPINLRTPGMLSPLSSRFFSSPPVCVAVRGRASAQNWAGAEGQLAGKIVSATGPKTMAVEVLNRSSLSAALSDDIRRNLLTQLAVTGVRFVTRRTGCGKRASLALRGPAKLCLGCGNSPGCECTRGRHGFPAAIRRPRRRTRSRGDGAPRSFPVVAAGTHSGCCGHRGQSGAHAGAGRERRDVVPDAGESLAGRAITSHCPFAAVAARSARKAGMRRDGDKDHLFDAYLPGVYCRGSASAALAMTCFESDDPWPIGADLFSLNASFTSSRNFFSGTLSPGVGTQTTAPAFYSAAPFLANKPRGGCWRRWMGKSICSTASPIR